MEVSDYIPDPSLHLQEGTLVCIEQEGGWVSEPGWTFWRRENSLAPTWI